MSSAEEQQGLSTATRDDDDDDDDNGDERRSRRTRIRIPLTASLLEASSSKEKENQDASSSSSASVSLPILLELNIPGNQDKFGVAAIGSLPEAHESALAWQETIMDRNKNSSTILHPSTNSDPNSGGDGGAGGDDAGGETTTSPNTTSKQEKNPVSSSFIPSGRIPTSTILQYVNPLQSSKEFYDNIRNHGWPTVDDMRKKKKKKQKVIDKSIYNLYLVRSGTWNAARVLQPDGYNRAKPGINEMCGVVYWHVDTINEKMKMMKKNDGNDNEDDKVGGDGTSFTTTTRLSNVATIIQHEICIYGNVGQYNEKEESITFLQQGGRICTRGTWESNGRAGIRNETLPTSHNWMKFRNETVQERIMNDDLWGPDFLFCPVVDYFNSIWPALQREGYGYKNKKDNNSEDGLDDDDSEDDESSVDVPSGPHLRCLGDDPTSFYAFFENQEYLAGRLLTTPIGNVLHNDDIYQATSHKEEDEKDLQEPDDSQRATEKGSIPPGAVYLIFLFTYACPEQLGDATIEGVPIWGPLAAPVTRTHEAFLDYVLLDTTTAQMLRRDIFYNISELKVLDLLENSIMRNTQDAQQFKVLQAIPKIVTALYDDSSIDHHHPTGGGRSNSTNFVSSPSLMRLHNQIIQYCQRRVVGQFVDSFYSLGLLPSLLNEVQVQHEATADEAPYGQSPSNGTLLGVSPTIQCAQMLLEAGAIPTIEIVENLWNRNTADSDDSSRIEIFNLLLSKLSATDSLTVRQNLGLDPSLTKPVA